MRAAPVLTHNLKADITGHSRKKFVPQKHYLKLISLGDKSALVEDYGKTFGDAYWIAEPVDIIAKNLIQYEEARRIEDHLSIHCEVDEERGATLVSVIAADHPGLFYRIAGGIHQEVGHEELVGVGRSRRLE